MSRTTSRGASPVVAVVLLVAVVTILATTVSVVAIGFADQVDEPVPVVARSSGALVSDVAGGTDQTVTLAHEGGEAVPVADLEIAVDAGDACGATARLVALPTNRLRTGNVEGDDILDNSYGGIGGEIDTSGDGTWTAGESVWFRLASTECRLDEGDRLTVRVVHTRSGGVVVEETLTAG